MKDCLIAYAIFSEEENFIFQVGEMTVVSLSNMLEISQPHGLCFWGWNHKVLVAWC